MTVKKLLTLMLVAAMIISTAACGEALPRGEVHDLSGTSETTGKIVDGIFKYDNTVTIKAMAKYDTASDPSNTWVYKWAKEKMNIEFVVEGIHRDAVEERTPLLMASGDYPEVFFAWQGFTRDTLSFYGDQEGHLIPINNYINVNVMPNLTKLDREIKEPLDLCRTLSGQIYGFPIYNQDLKTFANSAFECYWYNPKIFAKVGYDKAPDNLTDFLDLLRKIKEEDPMGAGKNNVPLGGTVNRNRPVTNILNAFGFVTTGVVNLVAFRNGDYRTGDMVFMMADPVYYEYFKYMNTLYTEGLIDRDFYTLDVAQSNAKFAEGYHAVMPIWSADAAPDALEWRIMEPMGSDFVNKRFTTTSSSGGLSGFAFLTDKCSEEKAEAICRFMDVGYGESRVTVNSSTDNIAHLLSSGPEKGTADGYGIIEGWTFNEDGVTKTYYINDSGSAAIADYRGEVGPFYQGSGFNNRTDGSEFNIYDYTTQHGLYNLEILNKLTPYVVLTYPGGMFTPEESVKIQDLDAVLRDYVVAESAKFITGARPLNEGEFAKYVDTLKSLGMDEYMEIQKKAHKEQFK